MCNWVCRADEKKNLLIVTVRGFCSIYSKEILTKFHFTRRFRNSWIWKSFFLSSCIKTETQFIHCISLNHFILFPSLHNNAIRRHSKRQLKDISQKTITFHSTKTKHTKIPHIYSDDHPNFVVYKRKIKYCDMISLPFFHKSN